MTTLTYVGFCEDFVGNLFIVSIDLAWLVIPTEILDEGFESVPLRRRADRGQEQREKEHSHPEDRKYLKTRTTEPAFYSAGLD